MNMVSVASYYSSQRLHPFSLLAQVASRQSSGCLQISDGDATWFLYLEAGQLTYASHSADPFGRLDRHLRRLNAQIPSLVSAVRVQVRLLFETPGEETNRDYAAICWLVDQQHLTPAQAAELIEGLSKEVIESLLPIQSGRQTLIEQHPLRDLPQFCQLSLRSLVEACQSQMRYRQPARPIAALSDLPKLATPPTPNQPTLTAVEPTREPSDATPATAAIDGITTSNPKTQRVTHTIACIDDSPTVLHAINAFLDDNSFSVVMINDPVKALMQVIRCKPDLILLDVTMPNLDGYELCSLLRKHPSFRHTPIVMVTGNTGFIDRAKARLVGASGYLTKPFTRPDLIKMVFKHLN